MPPGYGLRPVRWAILSRMTAANVTEMTDAELDPRLQPSELRDAPVMTRPRNRVFPGRPEQVAHARQFVAQTLNGCPVIDEAVLCVSELVTNALAHSASGSDGEFEIVVCRGQASALIAVYDDGSVTPPTARGLDATSEDGRGLGVVALTASRWGHFGGQSSRAVWFELCWDLPFGNTTGTVHQSPATLAALI